MVQRLVVASAVVAMASWAAPAANLDDLLPDAGKNDDWKQATANCRRLLARLDARTPLVARHLSRVRRCTEMLRRTSRFHWKSRTAVTFTENLLTDLAGGIEPTRRYAGKGLALPYWSKTMGRIEAIWVHVPPGCNPANKRPLVIYYKCGGGIHLKDGKVRGGYRPSVEIANATNTFHAWSSLNVQVKGRQGAEIELREAPAAIAAHLPVSTDRVFLSGWSDGGFTAYWLASRHPHLVAGIAPLCANWQYSNIADVGAWNVPMLCIDGWGDGGYNTIQFRRWHALGTAGADVTGLWAHHGHSYQPLEDLAEFRRILAWAETKRRKRAPRRVQYATWNLSWHRAYWVSIERMTEPWRAARIDARVGPDNRIDVRARNVGTYRLTLSQAPVDRAKPVTVRTNGEESYRGAFRADLAIQAAKPPVGKFVKSAEMPGGILAQLERSTYQTSPGGGLRMDGRKWMWVRPTAGPAETRKLLAGWAPNYAKDDSAITPDDMASANLFVFGGPDVNRLTARLADDLPLKFGKGRFTVGDRVYDGATNCVKFIHPNPLSPKRYVIVYAFNDAKAFAANRFFDTRSENVWGIRTGDCVVMGIPRRARRWGVDYTYQAMDRHRYVFDSTWRPPAGAPVGELRAPLSTAQWLRLRADAILEATGADVAVLGGYAPRWNMGTGRLDAGPVTTHDLATVELLPEYVSLCDVKGKDLARILDRAAAVAGPAKKIDPARTYRAAMGYRDLPTYRAEPKKMPPLHWFRTPEEFLAGGNTSLPVRNLRTTPMDMTGAVADYIRKRKAVTPRVVRDDLAQYVMDPQANEFARYDWLHLGADLVPRHAPGPARVAYRWTLNLALAHDGTADGASDPRGGKRFVELDLGAGKDTVVDLSATGRKLPVTAAAHVTRFAMAADATGTTFGLVQAGNGTAVAECTLVEVRLANAGKRPVAGLAVLAPSAMRRVDGDLWPDKSVRRPMRSWYEGLRRTLGPARKPSHQTAAVLIFPKAGEKLGMLTVPAGYNFGLVGIHRPLRVPAGGHASVPLLLVETHKAGMALDAAMEGMKGAIQAKLSIQALSP